MKYPDIKFNQLKIRSDFKTRPKDMKYIVLRFDSRDHYDKVCASGMDDSVEVVDCNFDWKKEEKWGAVGVFLFGKDVVWDKEKGEWR